MSEFCRRNGETSDMKHAPTSPSDHTYSFDQ